MVSFGSGTARGELGDHRIFVSGHPLTHGHITEVAKMHAGSQERWRQFYGWGYEGDEVSPQEVVEFEKA
jgi:hypothetical protein